MKLTGKYTQDDDEDYDEEDEEDKTSAKSVEHLLEK